MTRFYSNVRANSARIRPDELPGAIGVLSDPDKPGSILGIAFGAGWLGDWVTDRSKPKYPSEDRGPMEATRRIVIGKAEVDGRFALRRGEFVDLAEGTL